MGDGDEILNEFLFRRALLCIHHHKLALVSLTEMNQQGVSKACQGSWWASTTCSTSPARI